MLIPRFPSSLRQILTCAAFAIRLAGHWTGALVLSSMLAGSASAAETLNIAFTCHSATTNSFWQAVKLGFDDACTKVGAKGQFIFVQTEGSIEQQVANMQAAVAGKPDALITSLVDNNAFVGVLRDAREKGITVISSNVDATAGPELGLREAFIGQNFIPAGTTLGKRLSALFPKEGSVRVLVGVSAPGQNWAEQRAQGVMNGLEAFKKANPDRQSDHREDRLGYRSGRRLGPRRRLSQCPPRYYRLLRYGLLARRRGQGSQGPQCSAWQGASRRL